MKKILLACYGAGHVKSLIPIAKLINDNKNFKLTIIGFTTAKSEIISAGLNCLGCADIFKSFDKELKELMLSLINPFQNKDIQYNDALAYNLIGFKELIDEYGIEESISLVKKFGRKKYMPINAFKDYLEKTTPDIVITSTSPRFELALQRAAKILNIKSLAIGDLFLDKEYEYICDQNYSNNITVISETVKEFLYEKGFDGSIYVRGNPTFDDLFLDSNETKAKTYRKKLNLSDKDILILWICPPSNVRNEFCIDSNLVISYLIEYSSKRENIKFLIRQHPNSPIFDSNISLENGILCEKEIPIETCLHAADKVLVFNSTVLLQASLIGKPTIVYSLSKEPIYDQRFGLECKMINNLDDLDQYLDEEFIPDIKKMRTYNESKSALGIYNLINEIIHKEDKN